MATTTERSARKLAAKLGRTVRRPIRPDGSETFALTYVRVGSSPGEGRPPMLVVPGGPGLATVVPYSGLFSAAARRGLDLIAVEHRGVGLSRRDDSGADLPVDAVTLTSAADDLAAVLDAEGVSRAVVYGASYGTCLAQVLAARHPERVASLVLDSPMLSVQDDLAAVRALRRRLFWEGSEPATAPIAEQVRALADAGVPMAELVTATQVTYEFAGPDVLLRLLRARRRGRLLPLWRWLVGLGGSELEGGVPYVMEPDLVAGIAFGELGYGLPPDGEPLDTQLTFADVATRSPAFGGEPVDLAAKLSRRDIPVTVVSGERDLRTPRVVAQRVAALAPRGVLVPLPDTGHSALDTHRLAALTIAHAAREGTTDRLPALAHRLAALPRRGPSTFIGRALTAAVSATTRPV